MKRLFTLSFLLLLFGCASNPYDIGGNFNNVKLTHTDTSKVTHKIALDLKKRFYANAIFSFKYNKNDSFGQSLEASIRQLGMGISTTDSNQYKNLTYQLNKLNDSQFFIQVQVGNSHFQQIWVYQHHNLVAIPPISNFEGNHEPR